jgi:hypothetical protein
MQTAQQICKGFVYIYELTGRMLALRAGISQYILGAFGEIVCFK